MQEGFWHRWLSQGVENEFVRDKRLKMTTLDSWIACLNDRALAQSNLARMAKGDGDFSKAEDHYRLSSLYYNLIQWVFPNPDHNKVSWYNLCLNQFNNADNVSQDTIIKHKLPIKGNEYIGRVRIPQQKQDGVVIIINPIDSTKEELYLCEQDFAKAGFNVVSFDGAGQGETLLTNGVKASIPNWQMFVEGIIEFTSLEFPNQPIYLFGTSSGATWILECSRHPLVSKSVAVSPPPKHDIKMPDYFRERMKNILEAFDNGFIPLLEKIENSNNILVCHGGKDVMIEDHELHVVFNRISEPKRLIIYEEEGHCCNFALPEIRQRAIKWFKGEGLDAI